MNFPWFEQHRFLFIPTSLPGWAILVVTVGLTFQQFISVDQDSHSVSDTLTNFLFRAMLLWIAYSVIGFLTSRNSQGPDEE